MIKDFQLIQSGYNSSNEFYHKKKNYYFYNYQRPIEKLLKKRRMQLNVTGQSVLKQCWLPPVLIACYEKPTRPILLRFNKSVVSNIPLALTGNAVTFRRQQFRMPHFKSKIGSTATSDELCMGSVKFSVPVKVDYGDIVKVVGSHPSLGSWDCNYGVELIWNEGHIWEREVKIAPGEHEFKCVVVKDGGMQMWEPGPNRSIQISDSNVFNVACKWWDTKHTFISKESNIVKSTIDNILLNKVQLPLFPPKIVQELIIQTREAEEKRGEKIEEVLEIVNETELEKETIGFEKGEIKRGRMPSSQNNSIIDAANIKLKAKSNQRSVDINTHHHHHQQSSSNLPVESTIIEKNNTTFKLVTSGHIIPHVDKEKGGEDAYFMSEAFNGSMGLADGVGSWGREGIDPAMYAKTLMRNARRAIERQKGKKLTAKDVMVHAQYRTTVLGSSTCIIALINDDNFLDIANIGDSGLRVMRDGKIIFASEMQEHDFNLPYQLTHPDYAPGDKAAHSADTYLVEIQEGDVVILGSDGIFDNIWDKDLEDVVSFSMKNVEKTKEGAEALAESITRLAHQNAADRQFYSPWTAGAMQAMSESDWLPDDANGKNPYLGGKMDDCTAVVAFIQKE